MGYTICIDHISAISPIYHVNDLTIAFDVYLPNGILKISEPGIKAQSEIRQAHTAIQNELFYPTV